uniref:IgGFc_binding domain-containing protein n=1 Tax=Haemonchus contortus TaxID=6289 RepID=A0A7I4Z5Z3_HAECO
MSLWSTISHDHSNGISSVNICPCHATKPCWSSMQLCDYCSAVRMRWCAFILLITLQSFATRDSDDDDSSEEVYMDICEHPWQTHEQNILASYSQCSEFQDHGVRCTPHDPIECTGRNPVCVFSKQTKDYRCCSDVPQDLSNPPGIPEQVKPICPYGASSYDIPSVLLCDPTETDACPEEYTCEQAVNHQMLVTYNMHLCCKTSTLDSFENVFYETKVGINKMSANISMPLFYVTSISPSIIPHAPLRGIDYIVLNEHSATSTNIPPEIRTGDHFSMLPYRFRKPVYLKKVVLLHEQMRNEFHHVLVLYNPHGNPEAMNFYYNRPSSLSRDIDLTIPAWDEGIFFRNMNRVLTIQNDQISTKQVRKLYIVLVFLTKVRLTMRNPQTWRDFHANYTSFTELLSSETGKFLGVPVAGSYFYMTN